MTKRKGILQKAALVSAVVCFVLALVTGILLYFKLESLGSEHPISASLMASTFFFACVGVVLTVIGTADVPSFKFDNAKEK